MAALVYGEEAFSEKWLKERAKKYGFPQPQFVELLAWDYEIVGQLQHESSNIVLKGGAAAQLFLPPEVQRTSVDVDIIAPMNEEQIAEIISRVEERLKTVWSNARITQYKPKKPVPKLPVVTYDATLPSVFQRNKSCRVKIDVLLQQEKLPSIELKNVETVALETGKINCLTLGSLLGDKLVSLAENTVGIQHRPDHPKQMYDVDLLLTSNEIDEKHLKDALQAIKTIVPIEAKYRNKECTPVEALQDVMKTMTNYSLYDLPEHDKKIGENIDYFQTNYVSTPQKLNNYRWSIRALRINFLTNVFQSVLNNALSVWPAKNAGEPFTQQVWQAGYAVSMAKKLEKDVEKMRGGELEAVQKLLRTSLKQELQKPLKGSPPIRVYWQILTLENINEVISMVGKPEEERRRLKGDILFDLDETQKEIDRIKKELHKIGETWREIANKLIDNPDKLVFYGMQTKRAYLLDSAVDASNAKPKQEIQDLLSKLEDLLLKHRQLTEQREQLG